MATDKRQKLVHIHTGDNRAPSASVLNYGEIAVQHNSDLAALYTKISENEVAQFIDKKETEKLIRTIISGATQDDFLALKSYVDGLDEANDMALATVSGRVDTIESQFISAVTVNGVDATVTGHKASVSIDADDIEVGKDITYSGETLIPTTAKTADALQTLSTKIQGVESVVSESNHAHDNKAVLDGITSEKVSSWDDAAESAHSHENKALLDTYTQTEADLADAVSKKHEHDNKAELDLIESGDKAKWDAAASGLTGKVDKVEGKELSTNDFTDAYKDKLDSIAASADTNVIETVKVNGTALTVTDKAVDILVAEGTANGTVKVNGVDINVHGLGSAAFEDAGAFDASGSAATAKSEVIGDASDSGNTLGKLEDRLEAMETGASVSISTATTTEGYLKSYTFSQNGTEIGVIDIPKDLVVTSGEIVEVNDVKYLRLTIANQAEPVDIAVSDLADVYTQGNGIEISTGNVVSAKVVAGNGLSLDANGIAMAAASSNGAGAMSASDFDKLASVAASAQVNTVEGVQVNGADLTPDANKKVNVTIAAGTNNGTIAVNGSDVAVTGLGSAAFEDAGAFDASGSAATAKSELIGDMTGDTKTLGALQDAIEAIDAGDHNVIEGVQVNGSDLTPDSNKKVNVTVAEGSTDGTIAVNGSDVAVHGLGSAAFEDATAFDAAGAAEAASGAAITAVVGSSSDNSGATTVYGAKAYADQVAAAAVANAVTGASGDTLVEAIVSDNKVQVAASTALTAAVSAANSALQSVSNGTDGDYVTTTVGTKANGDQTIGVAVDVVEMTAATSSNKGLAEASDVKDYVDSAVSGKNVSASGDTLISATASANTVFVSATQDLQDAVAAANASVQGIATNKDSGAVLDADRKLDFSEFGIDCGEY